MEEIERGYAVVDAWAEYERRKALLSPLSPKEYEAALREIPDELKL